jgi:hypothetical protein
VNNITYKDANFNFINKGGGAMEIGGGTEPTSTSRRERVRATPRQPPQPASPEAREDEEKKPSIWKNPLSAIFGSGSKESSSKESAAAAEENRRRPAEVKPVEVKPPAVEAKSVVDQHQQTPHPRQKTEEKPAAASASGGSFMDRVSQFNPFKNLWGRGGGSQSQSRGGPYGSAPAGGGSSRRRRRRGRNGVWHHQVAAADSDSDASSVVTVGVQQPMPFADTDWYRPPTGAPEKKAPSRSRRRRRPSTRRSRGSTESKLELEREVEKLLENRMKDNDGQDKGTTTPRHSRSRAKGPLPDSPLPAMTKTASVDDIEHHKQQQQQKAYTRDQQQQQKQQEEEQQLEAHVGKAPDDGNCFYK